MITFRKQGNRILLRNKQNIPWCVFYKIKPQSSSNSSTDRTPRGRLDWGCDWCQSLSFGRVSGLCQVLITVECWHEFSAALQSNKKSPAEQAKVPQPPLELHDSYSTSQAQTLAIFFCPAVLLHSCRPHTGDLSMFLTGNWPTDCPFLLRSANRDRCVASPTSVTMCPRENTTAGNEKLTNWQKHFKSWVNYTMNHRQRTSSQHHQKSGRGFPDNTFDCLQRVKVRLFAHLKPTLMLRLTFAIPNIITRQYWAIIDGQALVKVTLKQNYSFCYYSAQFHALIIIYWMDTILINFLLPLNITFIWK